LVKPTIAELQSTALPLCYGAYKLFYSLTGFTAIENSSEPAAA